MIDRYAELEKKSAFPDGLYHEISRAMDKAPAVELNAIEWRVGSDDAAGATANPSASTALTAGTVPVGSEATIVQGTLKLGASANARQMLDTFSLFVEALKTNPELQIEILQRPFDIEPGKSLKGGDTTLEDNKPRSFSLQIVRKIEP